MAQPKYRLQTLLEMRERAEEEAKENLAKTKKKLQDEIDELGKRQQKLEQMIQDRLRRREDYSRQLASGQIKVSQQGMASRFIDRLKANEEDQNLRIDDQKKTIKAAEKNVTLAQEKLLKATQELKALQKHKEKWEEMVKKQINGKLEDLQDEIGQMLYMQHHDDSK